MTSDILHSLALGERPAGRTLLTADWLLAFRDGGHRLVPHGEMVMEDGAVIYAGFGQAGAVPGREG